MKITRTEALRRIIKQVNQSGPDLEVDGQGQILIYTGLFFDSHTGEIYDDSEDLEALEMDEDPNQ